LREISTKDILRAQLRTSARLAKDVFLSFAPVIDDDSLPEAPLDFIRAGGAKDIALIVGANLDEWRLFSSANPKHAELDETTLVKAVTSRLRGTPGADVEGIIATYRAGRPDAPPCDLLDAIETDRIFRVPAIRMAEAQSLHQSATYEYLFTWPSPARRGKLGSCHAIELPFVFGTFDAPTMDRFAGTGPEADALSEAMMDSWIAFARTGDPNCPALPNWSSFGEEKRPTMILDRELRVQDAPYDSERAAWDGLGV
jgi:para-nitrobenzyl esterase